MSGRRGCLFLKGRACPFPCQEIPLQTCQVCVETWKTEASLRFRAPGEPLHAAAAKGVGTMTEVQGTLARLGKLDQMFMEDNLDPEDT